MWPTNMQKGFSFDTFLRFLKKAGPKTFQLSTISWFHKNLSVTVHYKKGNSHRYHPKKQRNPKITQLPSPKKVTPRNKYKQIWKHTQDKIAHLIWLICKYIIQMNHQSKKIKGYSSCQKTSARLYRIILKQYPINHVITQ